MFECVSPLRGRIIQAVDTFNGSFFPYRLKAPECFETEWMSPV